VLQIAILASMMRAHRRTRHQLNALEQMVESDPATGCLNRRGFSRALDDAIASALPTRRDVALLALDLDHFKAINDLHGHIVGDAVLSAVAAQLADAVGDEGVVARLGGEEFAVLLPHADAEDAGVMAEKLLARVRALRLPVIGAGPVVTMSVGIAAERVISARDASALRARADEALYAAKRSGRDRIRLWASGVRSHATPAWSSPVVARGTGFSDSARPR
jgi:diguanylate cyclase (GGDEF)-like protein